MIITREFLAQYVYLDSYIKSIRRRLKYFETHPVLAEHGVVSGSMKNFPYAQCHFVVSGSRVKSEEERKKIVSQILGKVRAKMTVAVDMPKDEVIALAKAEPKIAELLDGKEIKKEIFVPGKLVNFVAM